jgi:predicted DNA-binding transcriptional regulator YafY
MLETSARLLRLLSLLQARPDWPGGELAERLGVSSRTVRRDIERLRDLGYPVQATRGAADYRLGAGATLPPLLLDDDEAVAVEIGLRTAAGGTVAGIEETSVRALAKLEQVLPSRLRHRVNALHAVTVPMGSGTAPVDPGVLTLIATACRDHERLRFDYHNHSGTSSTRTVEPHRLVHTGRRWYLLAWDTDREAWRTFRVDRVEPHIPTGPRFTPASHPTPTSPPTPPGWCPRRSIATRPAAPCTPRQRSSPSAFPPTVGVVEPIDEHTCRLDTGANSLEALAVHIALIGVDFEVHEPPELVETVRALAGTFGRAAR